MAHSNDSPSNSAENPNVEALVDKEAKIRDFARNLLLTRLGNQIRTDAVIKARDEQKISWAMAAGLQSHIIGRENAKPITINKNAQQALSENLLAIIADHEAPIGDIGEAFGIELKFLETGKLCDTQKDGSEGVVKIIREMQNSMKQTYPIAHVINSVLQSKIIPG